MSIDRKALIAQINQNVTDRVTTPTATPPLPPEQPDPRPVRKRAPRVTAQPGTKTKEKMTGTGKPAAFWVDDSDRQIFHELGMLLYTQGIKPSDSLILRAAIRLMPKDHRFIEQIRALQTQDGRKLRHQHT